MRIVANAVALPSKKLTNADALARIREESLKSFDAGVEPLDKMLKVLDRTLLAVGTHTRYTLDINKGETANQVIERACRSAMSQIHDLKHYDAVIWSSVFSTLGEPSSAGLIARQIGLYDAKPWDLKSACDGTISTFILANAMMKTYGWQRVMVVNGEFSLMKNYAIDPELYRFTNRMQLKHRLPAFTVGEAATATILDNDNGEPWPFTHITDNRLIGLCSVPPLWDVGEMPSGIGPDGPGKFASWAEDLSKAGIPMAIDVFKKSCIDPKTVDILFTHASSTKDWIYIANGIGLGDKHFDIHGQTGNLVSASVPAAMALAEQQGKLKRGMQVAVLCASAGMTVTATTFKY